MRSNVNTYIYNNRELSHSTQDVVPDSYREREQSCERRVEGCGSVCGSVCGHASLRASVCVTDVFGLDSVRSSQLGDKLLGIEADLDHVVEKSEERSQRERRDKQRNKTKLDNWGENTHRVVERNNMRKCMEQVIILSGSPLQHINKQLEGRGPTPEFRT